MEFKPRRKKDVHLDITPLVDTVFNLLIFFALSMNFTASSALQIETAETTAAPRQDLPTAHHIGIAENGALYLNRSAVSLAALQDRLQTLHAGDPARPVVVQADRRTPHEAVVRVLDLCQSLGFHNLSIAAACKKPGSG